MSSRPVRAEAARTDPTAIVDRRLVIMRSLVIENWLPGEWDPVRHLLTPSQDGLLSRRRACVVSDCPGDVTNTTGLCGSHSRQFSASGEQSAERWVAAGSPLPVRRYLWAETCAVTDNAGERCPRPCWEASRLCPTHRGAWSTEEARGSTLEAFMARAQPLVTFGDCTAASCYRAAAHEAGLCAVHYRLWLTAGAPQGDALVEWKRRTRQPTSRLVLSLRGLPELVRLEVLYGLQRRLADQVRTRPEAVGTFVDELRSVGVASVLDCDPATFNRTHYTDRSRLARFTLDRVALAYCDPDVEVGSDQWDMRVFSRRGHLDFSPIRQDWLREGVKRWAAATIGRTKTPLLKARVQAVSALSEVLASGRGGGSDPTALSRRDIDRFLLRLPSLHAPSTGEPFSAKSAFTITSTCGVVLREASATGFLPELDPTFAFRRGDASARFPKPDEGRAIPAHVVAVLDAHIDLLKTFPGTSPFTHLRTLGVLGERAGDVAVLAYLLLKGTGRRLGEVASLHLDCLDVDEHSKAVLVYDNHKGRRMRRRLPLADTSLVEAVRDQQRWVAERFPATPREELWLLPKPNKNVDGRAPIKGSMLSLWMRAWVTAIPRIAASPDGAGEAIPFDRRVITPRAFRPTYAQTLADQGVAPSVLRDLMDHKSMNTTLGYYRVNESRKRQAMELVARHTVDNRGAIRPVDQPSSRLVELREELSWVAVPMGKCSEPTNVRAGGQACPIRYQCAGCPHFESDPSYLPELRSYADDLRRERETLLALGAADWVVDNVDRQIDVMVEHAHRHEQLRGALDDSQRAAIEDASRTVRNARQSVPVAFGRRQHETGSG